jgi:hypothetical protein
MIKALFTILLSLATVNAIADPDRAYLIDKVSAEILILQQHQAAKKASGDADYKQAYDAYMVVVNQPINTKEKNDNQHALYHQAGIIKNENDAFARRYANILTTLKNELAQLNNKNYRMELLKDIEVPPDL